MSNYPPQRETKVYTGDILGVGPNTYFQSDLRRRQKKGWRLVSCTETGKNVFGKQTLTAIYERDQAAPQMPMQPQPAQGPTMNVQNVPLLLSILSPQERVQFEMEMQEVVNRWLARKAMGQ